MASIKGTWRRITDSSSISRSSQVISVSNNQVSIFGGEIKPRQPVDNKLYRISLKHDDGNSNSNNNRIETDDAKTTAPTPRVGSASTTVKGKTYIFSGRGGEAMAPIDEAGALHALDETSGSWTLISPSDSSAAMPEARSYHAMTSDGSSQIFVHAGCPEKGRLSDLWVFDLTARSWKQMASAPDPPRGGTSIAFLAGKLYRMNGFDGKNEQGFALDSYDLSTDTWTTTTWDVSEGPSPRSVSALLPLSLDGGKKELLVTMFGESDPSSLGHQGAGRMLDDVWAYDVAEAKWAKVEIEGEKPQARGWFAADVVPEAAQGKNSAVVHGGLAEDNTRLGDLWMLTV